MATLTLSGQQSYVGGVAGGSPLFGYDGSNRVVRYTFKTGSEDVSKVTLSGSITKSWGMYDVSSAYPIRFKITTSSTSHANAGSGSSYDGQITGTTVNVSVNIQLKANTTYYLWLFPGSTYTHLYYAYNNSGNPTLSIVTVAAPKGIVYINNEPYQAYIGNGTSWDQYNPYIGNGSSYDMCST